MSVMFPGHHSTSQAKEGKGIENIEYLNMPRAVSLELCLGSSNMGGAVSLELCLGSSNMGGAVSWEFLEMSLGICPGSS